MRWQGGRESDNVEDRRGMPGGPTVITGGLGTLVIILVALYFGVDPQALLNQTGGPMTGASSTRSPGPSDGGGPEDSNTKFVKTILADTEDVWREQFREMGRNYRDPKLVLFNGRVDSACGLASAAVGPFYCPADQKVYLDLSFFQQLSDQFGAPGDFARAYVIAHEIGHHVQNQLGISERMQQARARLSPEEYNKLSVRLELQADFLAGVWAHHAQEARQFLEQGDIEQAITAATAIGDDRLQMESKGYVAPDSFTHGTSAQRVRWFRKGLQSGNIRDGDTFNARDL